MNSQSSAFSVHRFCFAPVVSVKYERTQSYVLEKNLPRCVPLPNALLYLKRNRYQPSTYGQCSQAPQINTLQITVNKCVSCNFLNAGTRQDQRDFRHYKV
jgi:hypothetical protein